MIKTMITNKFAPSEQPVLPDGSREHRNHLGRLQDQDSYDLEEIELNSRLLIIEGISGSGKDTFQTYLKKKLKGRDVHDYSEGELLQSWKQLHIEGIFKLRVKFMKIFVDYVKDTITSKRERRFSFEQIPFVYVRDRQSFNNRNLKRNTMKSSMF